MIGVIFATLVEANFFLELSQAEKVGNAPVAVYQIPSKTQMVVAISGMGKVSAAVASQFLITSLKVDEIVNAGACGALQNGLPYHPGELMCVTSAVEGDYGLADRDPQPLKSDGRFDWKLPAARLVTCDRPVFDTTQRKALSAIGDLVDMEGAAIARVAAMNGISWSMVKGITDMAGPRDRSELARNLPQVCEKIGRVLWRQLGKYL